MNQTTKIGVFAIIGLVAIANVASVANGQVYEDATAEFFEAKGMSITEYVVNDDNSVTIVAVEVTGWAHEDVVSEFFANASYTVVEYSPEGGRNGELLIVADPIVAVVGLVQ